jgi:hypothetical protein
MPGEPPRAADRVRAAVLPRERRVPAVQARARGPAQEVPAEAGA